MRLGARKNPSENFPEFILTFLELILFITRLQNFFLEIQIFVWVPHIPNLL
jgi:hypothetical protein